MFLRGWNAKSNVCLVYLEVLKQEEMFDLHFKTLNGNKKSMTHAVSRYTL